MEEIEVIDEVLELREQKKQLRKAVRLLLNCFLSSEADKRKARITGQQILEETK